MPDRKEFIALFKMDAEELITKLDGGIIALEKDPNRLELIKDLNMYAHTIKGSARVFGFLQIQEIAHKMEDVFDQVLKKKLKFNSSIANRIFKALDRIKTLLGEDPESGKGKVDISDVCRGLAECLVPEGENKGGGTADKKDEKEPPALKPVQEASEDRAEPAVEAGGSKKKKTNDARDATGAEEYLRVPLSRVNKLLNLSGEMAIHKLKASSKIALLKRINTLAKEIQDAFLSLSEMIQATLSRPSDPLNRKINQCHARVQKFRENSVQLLDTLLMEAAYLDPVIDELQGNMKEIRMLPLLTIFEGFPRMVRDIASQKGKMVNLEITGGETGIDKKVLDGIKAPLMHILRNSVDHGIEEPAIREKVGKPRAGTVKISAGHEAANVVIRIEDDGKGLDAAEIEKIAIKKKLVSNSDLEKMTEKEIRNIIFMNGYSSSPIITDISGRGVGLDVAIKEIKNLKGQILLDSENGKGTTFTLVLPLTIAIIQVVLLKSQEKTFAIHSTSVTEIINVTAKDISTLDGKMAIQVRDHTVPVVRLDEILGLPAVAARKEERGQAPRQDFPVVIVSSFEKKVGFMVDEALGAEEVFIKSLGAYVGKVKNVSGAAILGTGEVVVILDVEDLLTSSRCSHPANLAKMTESQEQKQKKRILVMDDVLSTRELEKNILEAQGYTVDLAVDGVDGMEKILEGQYDLVVSDVEMPRMNGLEFCQNVRKNERYKDLPIVIVTALEKEEDKRRGIEVGASAYIVKTSFEQSNLLDTIERLIG